MTSGGATRGHPEKRETLWLLAASPTIWAGHLMVSYVTAAVWCAKFAGPDGSLGPVRIAIGVYTLLALAGIAAVGRSSWRRHRSGDPQVPHDADTDLDRYRFMGFASLLLSGLSAIAVLYAALTAVFIRTCR